MKSLNKMVELADRFEMKLSQAQAITGEDPKAVVADAFFDPTSSGKSERGFQAYILNPNSNFLKALSQDIKRCVIGAFIDARNKTAKFIVSTSPVATPTVLTNITNALNADYTKFYGKSPSERLLQKISAKAVKPDLQVSAPEIIVVT
jgi:hypothetical protein